MGNFKNILGLMLLLPAMCLGTFGDQELDVDGAKLIWNNNSQTISFAAPPSMSESVAYFWMGADGIPGQTIVTDGSGNLDWTNASTAFSHNIFSPTHTDTVTNTPTRGSIFYGDPTPKWNELTVGAASITALTKWLGTDGTDVGYRTTDEAADDIEGSIDHGNLEPGSLGDDDHTIYSKADGTRDYTGVVGGITPTASAHFTTKEYVDTAVAGLQFDMFLDDLDSTINDPITANDYYSLQTTETGDATTTRDAYASLGQGDDQEVVSYISGDVLPFAQLQVGIVDLHVHARKNNIGQKDAIIFARLYHRASGGTETLIATTEESAELTNVVTEYNLHGNMASMVDFSATDRLVLKIRANVQASGGGNAQIEITQEGIEDSFVSALVTTDTLSEVFVRQDEFTQDSGVLVGTGAGTFTEETGNTLQTSLGLAIGTDVLAEQTIGIADDNLLEVDGSPNDDEYARFTVNGLEGRTVAEVKSDLGITGIETWDGNVIFVDIGDDIETIAAAADADDTLILASGTYTVSDDIDITKALTIEGQGRGSTIIVIDTTSKNVIHGTASNIHIKNLTITGAVAGFQGIFFDGSGGDITGCTVENVDIESASSAGTKICIYYSDASGTVRDCRLTAVATSGVTRGLFVQVNIANAFNHIVTVYNVNVSISTSGTDGFGFYADDQSASNTCELLLYGCRAEDDSADTMEALQSVGAGASVVAENCVFDGSTHDVRNLSSTISLKDCVLVNNTTNGTITFAGTNVSGAFTDGTTSISDGNYTGVGNITGDDIDISAGTGDYSSSGDVSVTDITSAGIYNLAVSTSTVGQIKQNGVRLFHTFRPTDQATGNRNMFLGENAGSFSLDNSGESIHGTGNFAFGTDVLSSLTTGFFNFGFGTKVMRSLTEGNSNLGMGHQAARGLTLGSFNILFGRDCGINITIGDSNFAAGFEALRTLTIGDDNISIGNRSMKDTAIGINGCIAIGPHAGRDEDQSNRFIIDGFDRGSAAATRTSALMYGVMDATPANQTLAINATLSVLVDILPTTDNVVDLGSSAKEFKDLYIDGVARIDSLIADTADIDGGSFDGGTIGTNSAITELQVDLININGGSIISSGPRLLLDVGTGDTILLGSVANTVDSDTIRNTTTVDAANMFIESTGTHTIKRSTSSARYKTAIVDMPQNINPVLRPRQFKSTCKNDDPDKIRYGLIAEEVYTVFPEAVYLNEQGQPDALDWNMIVTALLKKQLDLEERIEALEK